MAQRAICRHQRDRSGGVGDDRDKLVVAAVGSVHDGDPVGHTRLDSPSGLPLEDNHDGLLQHSGDNGGTNLCDEYPCRPRSILPPARRSRADDIRRINEEHASIVPGSLVIEPRKRRCRRVVPSASVAWSGASRAIR